MKAQKSRPPDRNEFYCPREDTPLVPQMQNRSAATRTGEDYCPTMIFRMGQSVVSERKMGPGSSPSHTEAPSTPPRFSRGFF